MGVPTQVESAQRLFEWTFWIRCVPQIRHLICNGIFIRILETLHSTHVLLY
jgi:hypothetical protein